MHGIPKLVISDRDVKFTSAFWKDLYIELGAQIQFSTAYHPQIDGKTKHVNQVLEAMLRVYVMQQPNKWEEYFHLVDFAYNKGYHESLKMRTFKLLYGRRCRIPTNWNSPEKILMLGLDMLTEMEQTIKKVRQNLKASQDKQKAYPGRKRTYREFRVGDHVYV